MAVKQGYKNVYRDPKGFPQWQSHGLPIESRPPNLNQAQTEQNETRQLYGWGLLWTLLGVFFGGLALNLTPCVYPLIPITVSYFGSQTGHSRFKLMIHGLLYMLGLSFTNSLLGVTAAMTGNLMGSVLQSPIVLIAISGILIFFAASLFGFWEIRLPADLTGMASKSFAGYFGSLFMGLTLGIVAAPCLGPFILGLLTWVATLGSPFYGFLIFFVLSLGLGLPLLILGFFSGSLDRLPGSGEWMLWVRRLFGWILVGMAVYFSGSLFPRWLDVFLLTSIALAATIHLGWSAQGSASLGALNRLTNFSVVAGFAIATYIIGSWILIGPGVQWKEYSDRIIAEAVKLNKPVIIDFSASWCTPCRKLDDITFHDPDVVKQAETRFIMIKVDLTRKDPTIESLAAKYKVKGVPTIIFLDGKGKERKDLRFVDYAPPDRFLLMMAQVK